VAVSVEGASLLSPKPGVFGRTAVLFVHGTRLSSAQWQSQLRLLGKDVLGFAMVRLIGTG
jgi:hypothetical protein